MSQDKNSSFVPLGVKAAATTVMLVATATALPGKPVENPLQTSRNNVEYAQSRMSGPLMIYYPHATEEYSPTQSQSRQIDRAAREMQRRFEAIKHSFARYGTGLPAEKMNYFSVMANALCKLDFKDNVSSYNSEDESIDTVLKLKNGLTLSVSCFVDEDTDAPMVFSLHRGKTLLVSDELPVNEIVKTIISVKA